MWTKKSLALALSCVAGAAAATGPQVQCRACICRKICAPTPPRAPTRWAGRCLYSLLRGRALSQGQREGSGAGAGAPVQPQGVEPDCVALEDASGSCGRRLHVGGGGRVPCAHPARIATHRASCDERGGIRALLNTRPHACSR